MQPAAADPSEESSTETSQHIPTPRSTDEGKSALSERERDILAFEARWWKHAGSKEQAIRDTFALSSTRYYQVLNALIDKPEATEHDPVLVGRLRRLRATRARTRRR
jgi:hypothetical protein